MSEALNTIGDHNVLSIEPEPAPEQRRPRGRPRRDGTPAGSPRDGEPVNLFGPVQNSSAPKRTAPKKNIQPIKNLLVSVHMRLAMLAGMPELAIDDDEATLLAQSGADLMDFYKIKIDGKRGAMIAFIYAVSIVYGPRVFAFVLAQRLKAAAPKNDAISEPSE